MFQIIGSQYTIDCNEEDAAAHLLILGSCLSFEHSLVSHTTAVAERLGPCIKNHDFQRLPDSCNVKEMIVAYCCPLISQNSGCCAM